MEASKMLLVLVYCALAFLVSFCVPIYAQVWSKKIDNIVRYNERKRGILFAGVTVIILLCAALYMRLGLVFTVSCFCAGGLIAFVRRKHFLGNLVLFLSGMLTASYLAWWRTHDYTVSLTAIEGLRIVCYTAIAYLVLSQRDLNAMKAGSITALSPARWTLLAMSVALACAFVSYKGVISDPSLLTTWHHWSAYIGPGASTNAGAIPIHDFPAQYGFGPTILIATSCALTDCWTGFYWLNVVITTLFFAALAYTTMILSRRASLPTQAVLLLGVVICTLGWTMYPPNLISPLSTPSTSGMRFLPSALMVCFLVHTAILRLKKQLTNRSILQGHMLWAFGLYWSPEAGLHTTFLWAPFYVWVGVYFSVQPPSIKIFLRKTLDMTLVFLFLLVAFTVIFSLIFGERPLFSVYIASLRNPPGAMPVDYFASIWFAVGCFVLWIVAQRGASNTSMDDNIQIASWVVMLCAVVNFTYFLGRSHSNNILNLLPYFSILLISIRAAPNRWLFRQAASILLATLIGWSAIFGWENYSRAFTSGDYWDHARTDLKSVMGYGNGNNIGQFSNANVENEDASLKRQRELRDALEYILYDRGEAAEVFDLNMLLDATSPFGPWSGVHPISTVYFMSSQDRKTYLRNVMHRLGMPGWIVIHDQFSLSSIVDEYSAVYEQTELLEFGDYNAIRYAPKLNTEME